MIRALALPLALLAAAPALAQADTNAEIRAAARAFDAAQTGGDRAALDRLIAPDFLFVRGSGRVGGRKDFLDGFADPATKIAPFAIEDRLFLRVAPDVAIVGGKAWVKGTTAGKPFADHFRYADTLVRRDGRWLVVYKQITGLPVAARP